MQSYRITYISHNYQPLHKPLLKLLLFLLGTCMLAKKLLRVVLLVVYLFFNRLERIYSTPNEVFVFEFAADLEAVFWKSRQGYLRSKGWLIACGCQLPQQVPHWCLDAQCHRVERQTPVRLKGRDGEVGNPGLTQTALSTFCGVFLFSWEGNVGRPENKIL